MLVPGFRVIVVVMRAISSIAGVDLNREVGIRMASVTGLDHKSPC